MQLNLNTETLYAVLRLIAPLVSAGAAIFGWQVDVELVWKVLMIIATIAAGIYFWWWKDNPITDAAQKGHALTRRLKAKRAAEAEKVKELKAKAAEDEMLEREVESHE